MTWLTEHLVESLARIFHSPSSPGASWLVAQAFQPAVSPTFQSADRTNTLSACRLENLRYGRLESLRYVARCEISGLEPSSQMGAEADGSESRPYLTPGDVSCRSITRGGFFAIVVAGGFSGPVAVAQPTLPPDALEQFQEVIGNRVEAVTILGGDYAAAGGIYTFRSGSLADLSITKIGGGGAVASPSPLGLGDLEWAPVLQGNLGMVSAVNTFQTGYLAGNKMTYDTLAIAAGGGVAIYFTQHLSLSPTISGMYGHVQNTFHPQTPNGDFVESVGDGTVVNWSLDTWSVLPALELDYEWTWRRTTFEFSSRATFYHTESFESSSPIIGVNGDSTTWANKLDVDVPLGLHILGRELHTGGFFSRTELFGSAAQGLNTSYLYTADGRLVLDFLGKVWKLRWLGLGVSYFWGHDFHGWSAGVDVRFQF